MALSWLVNWEALPISPRYSLAAKQDFVVKLPAGQDSLPNGIQLGLGQLDSDGNSTTISLSMLQGL